MHLIHPRWWRQNLHSCLSSSSAFWPALPLEPTTAFPHLSGLYSADHPISAGPFVLDTLPLFSWTVLLMLSVLYLFLSTCSQREIHIFPLSTITTIEETRHLCRSRKKHKSIFICRDIHIIEKQNLTHISRKDKPNPGDREPPLLLFCQHQHCVEDTGYCLTHDSFPRDICQFHGGENENCGKESVLVRGNAITGNAEISAAQHTEVYFLFIGISYIFIFN